MEKQKIIPRKIIYNYDSEGNYLSGIMQYQIKYDTGKIDPKWYSIGLNAVADKDKALDIINTAVRHGCKAENMEVKDVGAKSIKIK